MKNCIYIFAFLLSISCQRNEGKSSLGQQIQKLHENGLFNGAIIVTDNDSVVLSKGFGYANFQQQKPFRTDTSMDTGSITKNFTALAMLMLADSNKIDLNTPVNVFIQEFPYESITIHHLLEQSSGIVSLEYVFDQADKDVPITNRTFLDILINDKPSLEFIPGSQFMYNNFNHRLLAIIIENITQLRYEEFIRKNITEPLGLKNWFLRPPRLHDLPKDRALGYSVEEDSVVLYDSEDFEAFYGDCNLFFSADDLSKWSSSFILNSLYPSDKLRTALNTKSSLSEINILHWYNLVNDRKNHFTGDWKGFYAMVYFDIEKRRSIVYLSNTNLAYWLRPMIVRNIDEYLDNSSIPGWEQPLPLELTNQEITGSYNLENNQIARIIDNNGELKIAINDKSVRLYKLDSNFYYSPGTDLWVWFSMDKKEVLNINCSSIYELNKGSKNSG